MDHLFTSAPTTLNAATATSLVFLTAGMLAVASSLQQIYEKVFRQGHRGLRDLGRLSPGSLCCASRWWRKALLNGR